MKLKAVTEIMLTLLMTSILIVLTSSVPTIAQANSTTTVYLNPPTIKGTTVGQEFTVNLMIRYAYQIRGWQAGLAFNATLLNCTGFFEGEFLKNVGSTLWQKGTINNTAGVITIYAAVLFGLENNATGDGRLGYLTFKVKAPGVSDLHLHDVKVIKGVATEVPINIIDVYTVVVDTIHYRVVTVSNSTGATAAYGSGFYDHAFSLLDKEISFKVTGPHPGFSNVTIPKALLSPVPPNVWAVIVDGKRLSTSEIIVTENATHTSIYFTYTMGIHKIQITSGPPPPPVGGKATPINMPINKPEFQTPWIWLSTIILSLATTVVFVKLKKKKQ